MNNDARYEYKIEAEWRQDFPPGFKGTKEDRLAMRLGELSAEGWEVVSTVGSDGGFRVLLRRKVKP